MSLFSAIDYSFATKALRTGSGISKKILHLSDGASECVNLPSSHGLKTNTAAIVNIIMLTMRA